MKDYDEAIEIHTKKLGFKIVEDIKLNDTKRWVLIAPEGLPGFCLLLAKAINENEIVCIGNQAGGRVFLFLQTHNFYEDYNNLVSNKVNIKREPIVEKHVLLLCLKTYTETCEI